jgi:hypothetical protein
MEKSTHSRRGLLLASLAFALPARAQGTMQVGPGRAVKTLAEASRQAKDGAVIEVDAGEYLADVAIWPQQGLTLRAVGGRVRLVAAGSSAQGKAIFVTRGEGQSIEGFDFIGCRVPDRNGAGIRLEGGSLRLVNCGFHDNENGILAGNNKDIRLVAEACEFGAIVRGDGHTHNLYVGRIGSCTITGCWFHHGQAGHLLKTRAAVNRIVCNRISDEGGHASIELEFPDGGDCTVIGNFIEKGRAPENPHLISYGVEGKPWERNVLRLAHNTLVAPGNSVWLRAAPFAEKVEMFNNLLLGNPGVWTQWSEQTGNYVVDAHGVTPELALLPGSSLRGKAVKIDDEDLRQTQQYRPPLGTVALKGRARNPGAAQQ